MGFKAPLPEDKELAASLPDVPEDSFDNEPAGAPAPSIAATTVAANREITELLERVLRDGKEKEASIKFLKDLLAKSEAEIAALQDGKLKWLNDIRKRNPLATEQVASVASKPFTPSGVVPLQRPVNGIVSRSQDSKPVLNVVNSEAPETAAHAFVSGNQPVLRKHGTPPKEVYAWLDQNKERVLFYLDKQRGAFVLEDTNVKTYAESVLAMLREAEQMYGDQGFQLTGSPEFIEFARELADQHGIVIKDEEYFNNQAAVMR